MKSDLNYIVKKVSKRIISEQHETIPIPKNFKALIRVFGENADPYEIIEYYNELICSPISPYIPLESFEDGYFWNKFNDKILVFAILKHLNDFMTK
jgi:hypothetical protein